jgi:hypothetical protein
MGILDERFTGTAAPCAHIKRAEIDEIDRLTKEWLKKQGLKSVPVVSSTKEIQPANLPIFNQAPEDKNNGKETKKIRQQVSSTGYMNLYERANGLYVVYIGAIKLCPPVPVEEALSIRDKHRSKMGLPPAKDKK